MPPEPHANCRRITPVGMAGGYALLSSESGATTHGLLRLPFNWIDLGTLGGAGTVPSAVNDAGVVVGVSAVNPNDTRPNITFHPFLWQAGVMTDLQQAWGGAAPVAIAHDGTVLLTWMARDGSNHTARWKAGATQDLGLHPEADRVKGSA